MCQKAWKNKIITKSAQKPTEQFQMNRILNQLLACDDIDSRVGPVQATDPPSHLGEEKARATGQAPSYYE
jgi:hypothetical protein